MIDSRSVSSSAPNTCTASAIGRFTYSARRRPLTRTERLSGFRRSPLQDGHGRKVRNSSSSSCAVQVASACRRRRFGIRPSKSLPKGSGGGPFLRDLADVPVSPPGPNSSRSRCFFGSFPNGVPRAMPKVSDSLASASRTSLRSPRAHGAMAPSARDLAGSGTTRPGSKSHVAPRPWHVVHAPCGELNENARGDISGTLMPQLTHAILRENSRSPSSRLLMTTMSSANCRAVCTDSVRRRSMPERTISRSTTTSIVWFFLRSSLMSSSRDLNWPSTRALV